MNDEAETLIAATEEWFIAHLDEDGCSEIAREIWEQHIAGARFVDIVGILICLLVHFHDQHNDGDETVADLLCGSILKVANRLWARKIDDKGR